MRQARSSDDGDGRWVHLPSEIVERRNDHDGHTTVHLNFKVLVYVILNLCILIGADVMFTGCITMTPWTPGPDFFETPETRRLGQQMEQDLNDTVNDVPHSPRKITSQTSGATGQQGGGQCSGNGPCVAGCGNGAYCSDGQCYYQNGDPCTNPSP